MPSSTAIEADLFGDADDALDLVNLNVDGPIEHRPQLLDNFQPRIGFVPVVNTGPLVEKCDVDEFMGRGTSEKNVVALLLVFQLGVREMLGYELNALAIVLWFEFVV